MKLNLLSVFLINQNFKIMVANGGKNAFLVYVSELFELY